MCAIRDHRASSGFESPKAIGAATPNNDVPLFRLFRPFRLYHSPFPAYSGFTNHSLRNDLEITALDLARGYVSGSTIGIDLLDSVNDVVP